MALRSKAAVSRVRAAVSARNWAYRAGNHSMRVGDLATAEARVSNAVDGFDDEPAWIQRLGFIQEKRGKYYEALATYNRAISLDGSVAEWYYRAGVCARKLGQSDEANELFQHAIDREPTHKRAAIAMVATLPRNLPGWRRMELLEKVIAANPETTTIQEAAHLAYSMRRFEDVISFVSRLREMGGAEINDLIILGSALAVLGEVANAYEVLNEAGELGTESKFETYGPGILLDQRSEWESSALIYEHHWQRTNQRNHYSAFGAAYALDRQYRWQDSLIWYERALRHTSNHPAYWAYKYAHALERVSNYSDAIVWYSRALHLGGGKQWDWYYRLGSCMTQGGNFREGYISLRRWLLKRSDAGVDTASAKSSDVDRYATVMENGNRIVEDLAAQSFGEALVARSVALSEEIDTQSRNLFDKARKFSILARQQLETGEFARADHFYDVAYKATGMADAEILDEWTSMLAKYDRYEVACRRILDHREFSRPDGLDLKKLIKSNYDRRRLRYAEYSDRFALAPQTVLFESYWGTRINDNPLAIYRSAIRDERFRDYEFFWTWDQKCDVPDDILDDERTHIVKYGSAFYDRILATADILINNTSFVEYFHRREGQRYLNTWHGTPLKTLGKHIGTGVLEHANVARNLLQCSDLVLPNEYTAEKLVNDYDVAALASFDISVIGSPRLDSVITASDRAKRHVRKVLGLEMTGLGAQRVVFYAPTWRGSASAKGQDLELALDTLRILAEDQKSVVLYRPHHLVPVEDSPGLPSNVLIVDESLDTYDVLCAADILVTDYSSLLFDFLATGRKVISYVPDLEHYRTERGLYIEPWEIVDEVATTEAELRTLLREDWAGPSKRYESSKRRFAANEDGAVGGRVLDLLLGASATGVASKQSDQEKTPLVFFESMIPNGIRSSFENLCSQISNDNYDLVLALDAKSLEQNVDRLSGLGNLPESVAVLGRIGSALNTLEERYAVERFSKNHGNVSKEIDELVNSGYRREFSRVFGRPSGANFIDFEGYSRFWSSLFSRGVPENCRSGVIVHNQMPREAEVRFPHLKEIVGNYAHFDAVASVATSISDDNREFARSLGVSNADEMTVVHNTLNVEAIRRSSNSESLWQRDDSDELRVVAVGRLSPEKNQTLMLEAIREVKTTHPNVSLKILGDGPSRSSLESLIISMGLAENVELVGFVDNPMPTIAGADVMAVSSLHEGQPMVILEAMCLGTPVVSTPVPGCVEAVKLGVGIIAGYDPGEFGAALIQAKNEKSQRTFDAYVYNSMAKSEFKEFILQMDRDMLA